jgi:hypothetical protein
MTIFWGKIRVEKTGNSDELLLCLQSWNIERQCFESSQEIHAYFGR